LAVPVVVLLMLTGFVFLLFTILSDMYIAELVTSILIIALFVAPIFLIFYLYDTLSVAYENKLKSALHAQEKEYYFTQCQLMQESVEQMKAFRHDIKLHLTTIKDYTANNQVNEATEYLNALFGDLGSNELYSETGNIAFDSIINFKFKNIKSADIKPDLKISIPPALNVEAVDIVTILGNLLDNALDAVAKVEEKVLKLDISFDKGGLFIKLENSFDGEVKYSKEQQILTSKNEDGHGYGLKNIRQSVEKYNGYMKLTHNGNNFCSVVFLYVDHNQMAIPA
jgi:sensor histidine kinase regulating citrate/malate metabolism